MSQAGSRKGARPIFVVPGSSSLRPSWSLYIHPHLALLTSPVFLSNPVTNDSDTNRQGLLLKRKIRFTFNNSAEYHLYAAPSNSAGSFQQLVLNRNETVELGSNIRREVRVSDDKGLFRHIYYGILQQAIRAEDVLINLVECAKEDWSFGNGIASYAS